MTTTFYTSLKIVPYFLRVSLLVVFLMVALSKDSMASLTIKNSDVVKSGDDYTYTYSLPFDSFEDAFNSDPESSTNMVFVRDGYAKFASVKNGESEASLVYVFDFTGLDYRPDHVEISNEVRAMVGGDTFNHDVVAATYYKLKESDPWIEMDHLDNSAHQEIVAESHPIDLGADVKKVYYKVEFTTTSSDGLGNTACQWARENDPAGSSPTGPQFVAKFHLVPVAKGK